MTIPTVHEIMKLDIPKLQMRSPPSVPVNPAGAGLVGSSSDCAIWYFGSGLMVE
jgi:hypothetical protein